MSGAEALAIVGGIAAFTELLTRTKDAISWIRCGPSGAQLSAETGDVEMRFELLAELQNLNTLLRAPPSHALSKLLNKMSEQLKELESLSGFEDSLRHAPKLERVKHAFKHPARTKKLQEALLSLDRSLTLVAQYFQLRFCSQSRIALESPSPQKVRATDSINEATGPEISSVAIQQYTSLIVGRSRHNIFPLNSRSSCARGTCSCRCHYNLEDRYTRKWMKGSPCSSLFVNCSCSTKTFSWTFTAFRHQISLFISLAYEQDISLSPSLRVCNTVPNTSPQFVVLHKCKHGFMSLNEALAQIRLIMGHGKSIFYDINREGYNCFEQLLRYPWDFGFRHIQFALLDYFMSEGFSIDSEKLLLLAIKWIGEGPHMALLETILPSDGGRPFMDPTKASAALFQKWPKSFDGNWISRSHSEDPFFIEALQLFVNHDPEFGDTGSLQNRIHSGNVGFVRDLLLRKGVPSLATEVNFLGQTALHISINKPSILDLLLSQGFAEIIDVEDRDGVTALMYAAAYGESISAVTLLRAGAKPFCVSKTNATYLDFAMESGNFGLIKEVVDFYVAEVDSDSAQITLDAALHRYIWRSIYSSDLGQSGFRMLLSLGARPKWTTEKGNTIFHAVNSVDMAAALLEVSDPAPDNQNCFGRTPLMALVCLLDVGIVRTLLSNGVSVVERDQVGWSVVEHLFRAARSRCSGIMCGGFCSTTEWVSTCEIVHAILQAGAEFGSSDSCTCYCAPHGCTALRFLLPDIHSRTRKIHNLGHIRWIVELYLLLRGSQKEGPQKLALSLYRRERFDELGMTHTCCLRSEDSFRLSHTTPYSVMMNEEMSRDDDDSASTNGKHANLSEIHEEQEQQGEELKNNCKRFEEAEDFANADWEAMIIRTLARRVVFIERGSAIAEAKAELRRQKPCRPSRVDRHSDQIEILSPAPHEYIIDYGKDEFTSTYASSSRWKPSKLPLIEDLIASYLQVGEKLEYEGLVLSDSPDDQEIHHERQRLCQILIDEVRAVREMSNEDADWSLDIVSEDK